MSQAFRRLTSAHALGLLLVLGSGCRHHAAPIAPPPELPPQQLVAAEAITPPAFDSRLIARDTAAEKHVDVDTHNRDVDVRPLLDFVAGAGGFTLIYPADLNRKVRVTLNDVPASVALDALLELAELQLEPTTPGAKPVSKPSVVFYELPVNVDALSVDAIMKRFGVGRAIAELIVKSRTGSPR